MPVPEAFYKLVGNVRKIIWDTADALQPPSMLADGVIALYGAFAR